jgi:hypothetical protein
VLITVKQYQMQYCSSFNPQILYIESGRDEQDVMIFSSRYLILDGSEICVFTLYSIYCYLTLQLKLETSLLLQLKALIIEYYYNVMLIKLKTGQPFGIFFLSHPNIRYSIATLAPRL